MVFQAWLGKTVVDSNLLPYRITIHMVMALLIVLGLIILLFISRKKTIPIPASLLMKILAISAIALTLFQIGLGTQVRQFVDLKIIRWYILTITVKVLVSPSDIILDCFRSNIVIHGCTGL